MRGSRQIPQTLALVTLMGVATASAQPAPPELKYDPPANFYKGAARNPDQYTSNEVNASMQVYAFRQAPANVQQQFRQNLLRDWIDPQFREQNVASAPVFSNGMIPGAQAAVIAQFSESVVGLAAPRLRVLILAPGGAAAILDASANSAYSWGRIEPAIRATLASMRVVAAPLEKTPAINSDPGSQGKLIPGLYLGHKAQYKPNLTRGVGFGDWVNSMHFYLFSADGRVYRSFDFTTLPESDMSRFNYERAQSDDPENSGRYAVRGNQVIIQIGNTERETITAHTPQGGMMKINEVVYQRQ